jgi:hypothetical protein
VTCFIYLCIAKEIRTLINTVDNSSQQQEPQKIDLQPSTKVAFCPVPTFTTDQETSSKAVNCEENHKTGSSNQPTSITTVFSFELTTTIQETSKNIHHLDENVEAGSTSHVASSSTVAENLSMIREERVQISHDGARSTAGLAWKLRAFKIVKYTFLSTIIPSVPMVVTQIVGYIRPDILNETVDMVISLCNVVHSIVFPLMFVFTVKR